MTKATFDYNGKIHTFSDIKPLISSKRIAILNGKIKYMIIVGESMFDVSEMTFFKALKDCPMQDFYSASAESEYWGIIESKYRKDMSFGLMVDFNMWVKSLDYTPSIQERLEKLKSMTGKRIHHI